MPQVIKHIDKIARDKGRGVLFIEFDEEVPPNSNFEDREFRNDLLMWFDANDIKVFPCGHFANELVLMDYRGQIYIDVPYDETLSDYIKVNNHLTNSDGSTRFPGVTFCYLPLEVAMKNKHHDEPGFWEDWADNF